MKTVEFWTKSKGSGKVSSIFSTASMG